MGVGFQGFFSNEVKDAIKRLPGAHFDGRSKLWRLKTDQREELIRAVGPICIEEEIQISDIP